MPDRSRKRPRDPNRLGKLIEHAWRHNAKREGRALFAQLLAGAADPAP